MSRRERACGKPGGRSGGIECDVHLVHARIRLTPVPSILAVRWIDPSLTTVVAMVLCPDAAPRVVPGYFGPARDGTLSPYGRIRSGRYLVNVTPRTWPSIVRGGAVTTRRPDALVPCQGNRWTALDGRGAKGQRPAVLDSNHPVVCACRSSGDYPGRAPTAVPA